MNMFRKWKHKGSDLLTKDDNNEIFDHVGRNFQILLTTVIELHRSPNASGEGDWKKEEIGVLCLVEDLLKKCYLFRIFCLFRKRVVWEYEINRSTGYSTPKPFLHSFQAENCMYAFYFVSEREASVLAVHMREISINLLEIEQKSARYKIHEINPVVETPRRRIFYSMFNKKEEYFSTDSNRLPLPSRLFRISSKNTLGTKKKEVNSENIANPEHFARISRISKFKEKRNQIEHDEKKDGSMLKIPFSESMLKLSPTLSESILPVLNETSNRPNAANTTISLQKEKSPHLSNGFSTFRHPGENITPRIEIVPSSSENFDTTAPPLPPKKSPIFNRRPFSSNPSISSEIENGLFSHSSSHLELNRHRIDHSTSSDYDFPLPLPLPLIVAKKRISYCADDLHHSNPNLSLYDVISGQRRPVNTPPHNFFVGKDSPGNDDRRESPTYSNSCSVHATVRRSSHEVVPITEATPKPYEVSSVTTQHPFLLFPSIGSSVSVPSASAPPRLDHIRTALNSAIKKGVQLKRTDGIRRKSFSRENDD